MDRLRKISTAGALALLLCAPVFAAEINYIEPGEGNPELPASATPSSDLELPLLPVEEESIEAEPAEPEPVVEEPADEAAPPIEPDSSTAPVSSPETEPGSAPGASWPEPVEIEAPVEVAAGEASAASEADPGEGGLEVPALPEVEASVPIAEELPEPVEIQAPVAELEAPVAEVDAPLVEASGPDYAARLEEAGRLLRSGNPAAAATAYEDIVNAQDVEPATYASALAGYASALRAAGRRAEAEARYQEALTYSPDDEELRLAYAYTLAENEKLDRALYQIDILEQSGASGGVATLARARALAWNGRFDEALAAYAQVSEPALQPDARLGRAYVLYWLGRADEARLALDQVDLPGNPDVRELQALLAQPVEQRERDASLAVAYRSREDSEDNSYSGSTAVVNIPLGPEGNRIFISHEDFELENNPAGLTSSGSNTRLGFTARVDDRTSLTGYAGRVSIDNSGSQAIDHTDIGLGITGWFDCNWSYSASYSDNLLYDSPALAANGIALQNVVLSTAFGVFDEDTTLELLYESGELSDGNSRRGYQLDLRRSVCYECRGEFGFGLRWRDLAFDQDLDHGYFDPESYQLAEVYLDWRDLSDSDVKFDVSAGIGLQKIDDGDWQQTLRFALGLRADLSDSFSLRAGLGHSDLPTNAAVSDDGYDAREWYLSGEWVF